MLPILSAALVAAGGVPAVAAPAATPAPSGTQAGCGSAATNCHAPTESPSPSGAFDPLYRVPGGIGVRGWAVDPDTPTAPITVTLTLDGTPADTLVAGLPRGDLFHVLPEVGPYHGYLGSIAADDGQHTVCVSEHNVGSGTDTSLGCRVIFGVFAGAPSAPQAVQAVAGYGSAVVTWQPPVSDGGAPIIGYAITVAPDARTVSVASNVGTATLTGLRAGVDYRLSLAAKNMIGTSPSVVVTVHTPTAPPPQTTPAPVSTSRYIRNIRGSSPAELATMRAEGAADARANPSGHSYLVLLDIGGQYGGGVLLSATTRYVAYADLARDIDAYVDGYHSAQAQSAPVTIAIGTNNDVSVTNASGRDWATQVVGPVRAHAGAYGGMTIAGANDIEPGFNGSYAATSSWLAGYLAATSAPFVFNGSADGCAWTTTDRSCNNGWKMSGLYQLAGGASPTRISNLPQIYNTTMAAQWKYISLTGVVHGHPRITFGGPLTEWTACDQSGSCGSMTGHTAWSTLWAQLQSDARLRVASLPFSTDLRIDW